jgi:probable DNA metabolism protein
MGVALNRAAHFIVCPGQPVSSRTVETKEERTVEAAGAPRRKSSVAVPSTSDRQLIFLTDGTFEGLLSAVFAAYAGRIEPAQICARRLHRPGLFEECAGIGSDAQQAARVWKGLQRHLGSDGRARLYLAYLTGEPGVETLIYRHIRAAIPAGADTSVRQDPAVRLAIERLSLKVRREAHRMKGLVRFSRMENDLYVALVNPRYDILPLVRRHFEKRYADQRWVIFDAARNYGLFFDTQKTSEVRTDSGLIPPEACRPGQIDDACRRLWRTYFSAADIAERRNPKLHLRHLPRRYWPYLPEKN